VSSFSPDRLVVALSDIEMGAGGVTDDFPHTGFLAELIDAYGGPRFAQITVDLVFNGDTFDLLKVPIDGQWPVFITEAVALKKLDKVIATHPEFFDALKRFLTTGGAERRVHFIVGNHDQELLFEAVQRVIATRIGVDGVNFPGVQLDIGDARFEHGSQVDPMFQIDPATPFLQSEAGQILALPWGTVAILEAALPLQPYLYDMDRLKPRARVFELVPEVRDLVVGSFWRYWTDSGWREWLGAHPLKRVSWTMLKEIAYRFGTLNTEVEEGEQYRKLLQEDDRLRLIVCGHVHKPSWWTFGDRKLLYTGCFRDEFAMDRVGNVISALPKCYAEVYLREDRVVRSHLVELDGPPPAPGHAPTSVFVVLPRIRPLLASSEDTAKMLREAADQVTREAEDQN